MSEKSTDTYIRELESEKKVIEGRIAVLQGEVRAINNLIYRYKSRLFAEGTSETVNQKNIDRLFFETLILDTIREAKGGLRTGQIFDRLRKQGYGLNYNTLRSYVTKMRDKELIRKRAPHAYEWVVAET